MLASRERREASVALTSTLRWFETDVLAAERNYQGLVRLNTALIQHAAARSPNRRVTLDIDSSESPVHGAQEGKAATHWTRLSCHRFRANEVRLILGVIAYNLGQSAASARPAGRHPKLVPDESPAAALQDRRAADPARAVLRAPTGRELLDRKPLPEDSRAH
jgi:hypothetical protein